MLYRNAKQDSGKIWRLPFMSYWMLEVEGVVNKMLPSMPKCCLLTAAGIRAYLVFPYFILRFWLAPLYQCLHCAEFERYFQSSILKFSYATALLEVLLVCKRSFESLQNLVTVTDHNKNRGLNLFYFHCFRFV